MKELVTTKLNVCPVRARPDETSEMVTQFIFGEEAEVLDRRKNGWTRIRISLDQYEGWVDTKMMVPINNRRRHQIHYAIDVFGQIFADDDSTWISMGASLPNFDGMVTEIGDATFRYSGQAVNASDLSPSADLIERLSKKLLNTPYLWGGRTAAGIDCSGFTQLIMKCNGISLPRDAKDQARVGDMIDFVSETKTGDLAFFSKKSDRITHVGIILPDTKIIHASGKVRIDTMDHYGIFNEEMQEYTHRLKIIRRYF